MRKPHFVKSNVGADHVFGDPRASLPRAPDGGALPDDVGKCGIESHVEQLPPDGFVQALAYVQLGWTEHHARMGGKPEEGRAGVVGPGKDALRVGGEHALGGQVAPVGDEALGIRLARVWKWIPGSEKRCGHACHFSARCTGNGFGVRLL